MRRPRGAGERMEQPAAPRLSSAAQPDLCLFSPKQGDNMTEKTIEQTIKEMLVERLFLQVKPEDIGDTAPLMETLGIDSIQIFEIVVGLEETYGLSFKDDEFNVEVFRSVKSIADYVRAKQG